jgi:hypothetical protein
MTATEFAFAKLATYKLLGEAALRGQLFNYEYFQKGQVKCELKS